VRQAGLKTKDLVGGYRFSQHQIDVVDAKTQAADQDIAFSVSDLFVRIIPRRRCDLHRIAGLLAARRRGDASIIGFQTRASVTEHLTPHSDGTFTAPAGVLGLVPPDRGFILHTQFQGGSFSFSFGVPSLP